MDRRERIEELNRHFEIAGSAQVVAGNGGFPKVRLTSKSSTAEIYLHGAQVTSWRAVDGEEVIFLSKKSYWKNGRAIRGGIPVCFPWFRAKVDDPRAPAHGFVRTKEWRLDSIEAEKEGTVTATFSTGSDESTRKWWSHEFGLVLRVTTGEVLELELAVTNKGTGPFRVEEALHTYFKVADVEKVHVRGLDQIAYLDNTDQNRQKVQQGDVVLTARTDNAYVQAPGAVAFTDPIAGRTVKTDKENSRTTIVWNPWEQAARELADLGDDEWHEMICVEASNILASAVEVAPGEKHVMKATLSVAPLDMPSK
jgi:glucose-6-phosphate 1-epimerase